MNTGYKTLWYTLAAIALFLLESNVSDNYARAVCLDETQHESHSQCVIVELFVDQTRLLDQQLESRVREFARERGGILIAVRKLQDGTAGKDRLAQITGHFNIEPNDKPLLYCLNQVIYGKEAAADYQKSLEHTMQIEVFVRAGCSRCDALKRFLPSYLASYPALKVVYRDITLDSSAIKKLNQLVAEYKRAATSVPVIHFCNELSIGFINEQTSQKQLDELLKKWTKACPPLKKSTVGPERQKQLKPDESSNTLFPRWKFDGRVERNAMGLQQKVFVTTGWSLAPFRESLKLPISTIAILNMLQNQPPEQFDELEIDDQELMLPLDDSMAHGANEKEPGSIPSPDDRSSIEVPWFGSLNASDLGMPLFTVAVGLVDGFNPCAMWVLLFLLSILVNLQDRFRIVLIAGIFVLISGLAYYAFMAAWLNVFLFIGLLRPIQVALGFLALLVGGIHIKDFFAFKKGVSLSIPESAKPSIYQRARDVVTAQNLWGALIGVTILAVLVNIVELLCTAGLPALYTSVLTLQKLPSWQNYAYLGLYIVAYMFDDTLMVVIVVWTMKKTKMQENQGRWLKLVSGIVIVVIGLVMLIRPEILY